MTYYTRFHRRVAVRVPVGGLRDRLGWLGGLASRAGTIAAPRQPEGVTDAGVLLASPGAMLIVDLEAPLVGDAPVLLMDAFGAAASIPADHLPDFLPAAAVNWTAIGVIVAVHDRAIGAGYGAIIGNPDDPLNDQDSPESTAARRRAGPPRPGYTIKTVGKVLHVPTLVLETPLLGEGLQAPATN